jgi:hypothetical protein
LTFAGEFDGDNASTTIAGGEFEQPPDSLLELDVQRTRGRLYDDLAVVKLIPFGDLGTLG